MDWIKVLNKHTIFEYNDLSDSEFRAWIKIMSLTAFMETMPTREQILKYVHHATLKSLDDKLMKHSCCLHDVLMKVLCDAHDVVMKREGWKEKKRKKREAMKNVQGDVLGDVSDKRREEKRREENKKNIKPQKIAFVLPEWIKKETWEAYREMRTRKRAPLTDRAATLIVRELDKLRKLGDQPEDVLNQSIMKSWTGVFPVNRGGNGNGRSATPFSDEKRSSVLARQDAEVDEITRRRFARESARGDTGGNAIPDDVQDFQVPER